MAIPQTTRQRLTLSGLSLAILLAVSHATNDAFANVLPVFLPTFQERFGVGEAILATFVAVVSLSSNVLQPFMGALSDRWGRRRTAALGLIVGSVLMSFLAVVPNVWVLFLLLIVGGLGSAIFHPSAVSMARAVGERKGLSVGFFTSGGPLGAAIMPIVVLFLLRNYGAASVPWLGIIGVIIGIMLFTLTPEQRKITGKDRPKVFDLNLFLGPVGLLAASGIMRSMAFITFINAMPLWLVNVKGFAQDDAIIGWTLAVFSAAASAGVLVSGALEHRFGRQRLIAGSMLLALPFALSVFVISPSSLLYYLVVAAAGFLANAAIPLMVVSAQDLAPNAIATASGMLMGFTWGTAGVLYIGAGALQEAIGIAPAMVLSYFFLIPAAILALYVLRTHKLA